MSDTVIVTNISKALTEENIRDLFNCVGQIKKLVWSDRETEYSCNITFDSPNCVKAAVLLSGTPLGDRPLSVTETVHSSQLYAAEIAATTPQIKKLMTPAETIASLNAAAMKLNPELAMLSDDQRREEDLIARTVYIGNISPVVTEAELRQFFNICGNIMYIKVAGNPAQGVKYAFMEYDTPEAAQKAIDLTGTGATLADRPVKVGPAMNSIVKPASEAVNSDPKRIDDAMSRAMRAKRRLEERKKTKKTSSGDKDKDKGKEKSRYRRSRSRSPRRSRRKRRSRSRPRDSKNNISKRYDVYIPRFRAPSARPFPRASSNQAHEGLVWDGFQWTRPSTQSIQQKSENLATKIMDVVSTDKHRINPSSQQAMVQQAHQQAALLRAHVERVNKQQ